MATNMKSLNGYGFDASALGGKAPAYYLQPRNLLDNSDFEIAQAGYGGKHGSTVYAADRWMQNDTTERTYTYTTKNGHGALKCSTDTRIQQKLHLVDGQNYTVAFYINNTLHILNFTANGAENGSGAIWVNKQSDGTYMFIISSIPAGGIVYEPVLYIGSYTADTLPPYVPKGYAVELAECQRYFQVYNNIYHAEGMGYAYSSSVCRFIIPTPQTLRIDPSIESVQGDSTSHNIKVQLGGNSITPTSVSAKISNNRILLTIGGNFTEGAVGVLRLESSLKFSADL